MSNNNCEPPVTRSPERPLTLLQAAATNAEKGYRGLQATKVLSSIYEWCMDLRGLLGAKDEVLLTATAQNLRRLAKLIWQPPQRASSAGVQSPRSVGVDMRPINICAEVHDRHKARFATRSFRKRKRSPPTNDERGMTVTHYPVFAVVLSRPSSAQRDGPEAAE